MSNKVLVEKARELRKEGLSYKKIRSILGISLSSLSYMLKNVVLTHEQLDKLNIEHKNGKFVNKKKEKSAPVAQWKEQRPLSKTWEPSEWKVEKVVSKDDYNYVVVRNHPHALKHGGYVLEHRVVMELHLGRVLDPKELVHHKNGNKKDNRIENLELMSAKEHNVLHQKGLLYTIFCCPCCKKIFSKEKRNTHLSKGGTATFCSRSCAGKFSKNKVLHGKTPEVERAISENIVGEYRKYHNDNPEQTV